MSHFALIGVFAALCAALIAIAGTWSMTRAVQPAISPDTTPTPNPDAPPK